VPRPRDPNRKKLLTFYIDQDLAKGLKALRKQEPDISEGEQIRLAIRARLTSKGVLKAERKRR